MYSSCGSNYIGRTFPILDARIKQHDFFEGPMDTLRNTYGCSIAEHQINNRDWLSWKVYCGLFLGSK